MRIGILGCMLAATSLWASEPNSVIATIGVGQNPSGIAILPNNFIAYVANNNNAGVLGGDSVSVINLLNNTLAETIHDNSFNGPFTITLNPEGTKAYVTNSNTTTVSVIDIATNTVSDVIDGFNGPAGCAITPDGHYAYISNFGYAPHNGEGTTVHRVDLSSNAIVGTGIPVGTGPVALALTPDGASVYVISYIDGNPGTGTVSIIQTSDDSVQTNALSGLFGPFWIAITPDGKYAYVTNFGSDNFTPVGTTLTVISLESNTIVDTIPVGLQAAGLAISPDGKYAYSSNYSTLYNGVDFTDLVSSQGTINIIDIATNTVLAPIIGVGYSPDMIAISPNGLYAYVSNYSSNTVSVIELPSTSYDLNRISFSYYQELDKTKAILQGAGL